MANKQKTDVKLVTPAQTVSTSPNTNSVPTMASNSSTPQCNAFACGQQNSELQRRIDLLERKVQVLEETAADKRKFLKKAESLLMVFRVVLISIPIVLCVAMAIVLYFCYEDSKLLNIVTSIIGLVAIAECVALPILWKNTAERVSAIEEQLRE